jgi:hypothetical protein
MSYDEDWPDNTMENRRLMAKKTIRPASIDELRELGEKRFPVVTDPWCEQYNNFLKEHAAEKFYRAEIENDTEVIYCRNSEKAMWFLPGRGMGVVQPKGLAILKEIVDAL